MNPSSSKFENVPQWRPTPAFSPQWDTPLEQGLSVPLNYQLTITNTSSLCPWPIVASHSQIRGNVNVFTEDNNSILYEGHEYEVPRGIYNDSIFPLQTEQATHHWPNTEEEYNG